MNGDSAFSARRPAAHQFWRYAIVGLVSNAVLYALYLVATAGGVAPKAAMSVLYGMGVLQTFVFNKRWSFRDRGPEGAALLRHCVAYASGYVLNYAVLSLLVDRLGFAHQEVQGIAILALALYLFLLQRYWVYQRQT